MTKMKKPPGRFIDVQLRAVLGEVFENPPPFLGLGTMPQCKLFGTIIKIRWEGQLVEPSIH